MVKNMILQILLLTTVLGMSSLAQNMTSDDKESWYSSPSLGIMSGFIYEPRSSYSMEEWLNTMEEWLNNLGNEFDADQWVTEFKQLGADYLIFYDKWHDGLVFHDTKTTSFKSNRDFVREIVDACHRQDFKLMFYFNAVNDGNPEFHQWALEDKAGRPKMLAESWPLRVQTLNSPYRDYCVEQVKELLTNYGKVNGIWLDTYNEWSNTNSKWVVQAYEQMFGESFKQGSPERIAEFQSRILAGFVDQIKAIAHENQSDFVCTANGSGRRIFWPHYATWVCSLLDYISHEAHGFVPNDLHARRAWTLDRPVEVGLLISSNWFTPIDEVRPPEYNRRAKMTEEQAVATAAITMCQGASVYLGISPSHAGKFGEEIEMAKAIGTWYRSTKPALENVQPYRDIPVILGAPAGHASGLPKKNTLWKDYPFLQKSALEQAIAVADSLSRTGLFSSMVYELLGTGSFNESIFECPAVILLERAPIDQTHRDLLRQYVKDGGTLIAFGHASMLDDAGNLQNEFLLADLFGVDYKGEVELAPLRTGVDVKADSEHPNHPAINLIKPGLTQWVSADTKMPHWSEILFPEPVTVASIEVQRDRRRLVTDFDIEAQINGEYQLLKSVHSVDVDDNIISVSLDHPVHTDKIRITVNQSLFQEGPINRADLYQVCVIDTEGQNRAIADPPVRVSMNAVHGDFQYAFDDDGAVFPPIAVQVEPTTAEILSTVKSETASYPALTRNTYGKGSAIFIATTEAAYPKGHPFWRGLQNLTVGKPTLDCSSEELDRYRIILTKRDDVHILHVIDSWAGIKNYKPGEITVSVNTERIPLKSSVMSVVDNKKIKTTRRGKQLNFTITPDPVESVYLR